MSSKKSCQEDGERLGGFFARLRTRLGFSLLLFLLFLVPARTLAVEEGDLKAKYEAALSFYQGGDMEKAKFAFGDFLQRTSPEQISPLAYYDTVLFLAKAKSVLGEFEEANALLKQVERAAPSGRLVLQAATARAENLSKMGQAGDAFLVLLSASKRTNPREWKANERTFFIGLAQTLNDYYSDLLRSCERLGEAGLNSECLPLLTEVVDAIRDGKYPGALSEPDGSRLLAKLLLRRAELLYEVGEFEAALKDLPTSSAENGDGKSLSIHLDSLLLLGKVKSAVGKYAEAEQVIQALLGHPLCSPSLKKQALWELSSMEYEQKDYKKAERGFRELLKMEGESTEAESHGALGRTLYALGHLDEAFTQLQLGMAKMEQGSRLYMESAYLLGRILESEKEFSSAISYYEKALLGQEPKSTSWYLPTLIHLGDCLLTQQASSNKEAAQILHRAEQAYEAIKEAGALQKGRLGLAKVLLRRAALFGEEEAEAKALGILQREDSFTNEDCLVESLLLRADATSSLIEKIQIYLRLSHEKYSAFPHFPQSCFLLACHEFEMASTFLNEGIMEQAVNGYEKALPTLEAAERLLLEGEPRKALLMRKLQAEARFHMGGEAQQRAALSLLTSLTNDNNFFTYLDDPAEILYLRALVASHLYQDSMADTDLAIVADSLERLGSLENPGVCYEKGLYLWGTTLFEAGEFDRAEKNFIQLAQRFPESNLAAESWFWAAESAERLQKDQEILRKLRKHVYEGFPSSPFASRAYFYSYSFWEYLQGDEEAILHLEKMPEVFPESSLLVATYFLLGMDAKQERLLSDGVSIRAPDPSQALYAFQKTWEAFDRFYTAGEIETENTEYFINLRYRALLEHALLRLNLANSSQGRKRVNHLEAAIASLESLVEDFETAQHALATTLIESQQFPSTFEEGLFALGKGYQALGNSRKAQEAFQRLIELATSYKRSKGFYLSQSYFNLGLMDLKAGSVEAALESFLDAEEAGHPNYLGMDQRLELWVELASCQRDLGQYDDALKTLARAINDESPSALRIKAMYLRGEIFSMQGNDELAIKQFESTSTKGGDWAKKAEDRLRQHYGYY